MNFVILIEYGIPDMIYQGQVHQQMRLLYNDQLLGYSLESSKNHHLLKEEESRVYMKVHRYYQIGVMT